MATALITGGSAGIGAAFAARLAADGYDLILVARDPERLCRTASELRRDHGVSVSVLPADLADPAHRALVERRLAETPVNMLINSAGCEPAGGSGQLSAHDRTELTITAALRLSSAVLPAMISRGDGVVVTVGGVLPQAGAFLAAARAWAVAFTGSVAATLDDTGVQVIAVCPGRVTDGPARFLRLTPDQVVAACFDGLARGRTVCTPGSRLPLAAPEPARRMAGALARLVQRSPAPADPAGSPVPAGAGAADRVPAVAPSTAVARVVAQRAAHRTTRPPHRQGAQRVGPPGCVRSGGDPRPAAVPTS